MWPVEAEDLGDVITKVIYIVPNAPHSKLAKVTEILSNLSGIEVELELPGDSARLPKLLELVIFRVAQESLTNVHRHSDSPTARIRLTQSSRLVEFEIVDQGKGISEERQRDLATAQVGVGVRGMEERVRQFGGTLRIQSSPTGTSICGTIPLEDRD